MANPAPNVSRCALDLLLLLACCPTSYAEAGHAPGEQVDKRVAELLAKLNAKNSTFREAAAKELAKSEGKDILSSLRKRAAIEKDFLVRLALHYALAFHGDRQALNVLVEALSPTDHRGAAYLKDLTGRQFGSDAGDWKKWIQATSDADFQKIVAERRLPAKVLEAAEDEFGAATSFLQGRVFEEGGDRASAARMFRRVVDKYPRSNFGRESQELCELLEKMIEEEKSWNDSCEKSKKSLESQIKYHIYQLRNLNTYQTSHPGRCRVFDDSLQIKVAYNGAIELRKIGPPAIPALIGLLEDRRPTRSVSDGFSGCPTVLRYQDAAIEILNELLPAQFYRASSTEAYLSNEFPEVRAATIGAIRGWYKASRGKTPLEQTWLALPYLGIYPALDLLRELAKEPGQKQNVLAELRRMYDDRHWVFQPYIAEALADLGDRSKVSEVLQLHQKGKYSTSYIQRPDDSIASYNAEDAAKRLLHKYGAETRDQRPDNP